MSDDKTEKPTPKKLRDAREKGQVAKSKDVVTSSQMAVGFLFLWGAWDYHMERFMALFQFPEGWLELPFEQVFQEMLIKSVIEFFYLALPFVLIMAAVAIVGFMAQFGFLFAVQTLAPDFNKLNPFNGLKQIFTIKTIVETLKQIAIVTVLAIILYFVIKNSIQSIVNVPYCDMSCLRSLAGTLIVRIFLFSVPIFLIIAIIDFAFQKSQFIKQNKMSKEDIKQEYKNTEGDPQVKGERKKVAKEMLNESLVEAVKKFGTAVVTAGMKYAIVLWYEPGETPLPIVSFIARNKQAAQAYALAREHKVPIIEDPALVVAMFESGKLKNNAYIPTNLIDEIAKVIRTANEMKAQQEKQ